MTSIEKPDSAPRKFFHLLAVVSLGLVFSHGARTFAVEPVYRYLPVVKTEAVQGIGRDYAVLSAEINPQGSETQGFFEYGSSPAASLWSFRSPYSYAGKDFTNVRKVFWLSGLHPDTVYYYRAVASNKNGSAYGEIISFKTEAIKAAVPSVSPSSRKVSAPKNRELQISPRGIENAIRAGFNLKKVESSPELREIASTSKPAFINLFLFSALIIIVYFIIRK